MPSRIRSPIDEGDPLTLAMAPPEDESQLQKELRLQMEAEAKKRSDAIDEELERQRQAEKRNPKPVRVLLLGQTESGKSTTLKNFQLMTDPKAFATERASWRAVIQLNLVRSIHVVLDAMTRISDKPGTSSKSSSSSSSPPSSDSSLIEAGIDPELLELRRRLAPLLQVEELLTRRLTPTGYGEVGTTELAPVSTSLERTRTVFKEVAVNSAVPWKDVLNKITGKSGGDAPLVDWNDPNDPGRILHECAEDMKRLWNHKAVQEMLEKQNLRLEEMAGFFLDSLDEVTSSEYLPSNDHILRARLKTLGISEHRVRLQTALTLRLLLLNGLLGLLAIRASRGLVRAQTVVTVNGTASHPIPSTLWGYMYEDINVSRIPPCPVFVNTQSCLDASILEMEDFTQNNRAFQKVTPGDSQALNAWQAVNGASLEVIADPSPVSNALPNSLQVQIPSNPSGQVGVANEGYFGIKVDSSWTYKASFYYRFTTASNFSGNAVISLQTSNGDLLGSAEVPISGAQTTFTQVNATITPTSTASGTDNLFVVTVDGAAAAGQTINFALFSLFPPTFKDRPNGMRIDLAETLAEVGPSLFRWPGGNNLEGQTVARRWQWNATVGPLTERPGRLGDWSYVNTDGLGMLEYLEWCEDLGMESIMGVWAGYALGGTSVPEAELGPYIQQAIDQINFVIGDPATSDAAALRASLGRSEPFKLTRVEVGNEDFLASESYVYRWKAFVTALKAEFPQLRFIATNRQHDNDPVLNPKPDEWDIHIYQTPRWFAENSFFYDDIERDGTLYFEGEYAVTSTNSSDIFGSPSTGRLTYPTMEGASAEAAFMIGFERNADIVYASAYAPLLNHVKGSQWTPNLVSFDAENVIRSTSFYTQKLFSLNRGTEYLPSTLPTRNGALYWSVVRDTSVTPNKIIIKVTNTAENAETLQFDLPFAVSTSGTAEVLTGERAASNTPDAPSAVTPQKSTIETDQSFSYDAPGYSISVLTVTVA
ncbi:hypothetical protein D9758_007631 [Tetrapyrgos nigripes]|uniref:non-reducing end alpha-L-arabinofuranosidase n=1 Tax=Tetrapyrgos nigripes TaxID=182062 RepID=A0A8H5G818_9AGAR|nr:hypothetical protein D9758_007631 [Tetrapyrgos nigripes]